MGLVERFVSATLGHRAFVLVCLVALVVTGVLAGFASRIFMPITLTQAFVHTRLWWPDLFVDNHTTDGADYRFDVTYATNHGAGMPVALDRWCAKRR